MKKNETKIRPSKEHHTMYYLVSGFHLAAANQLYLTVC